ncbi:unnamed protein product [Paramecium octaurelia]|uniref:Uncharacterized protein n=1 Tax=Paramecium octaurelia TaxID=43137 RepID=A0A8S1WVY7_PAROT|nr:unnamed protein product [Paramecium octaurelia]
MNCTHHIRNYVSIICIAPHKCSHQRKLCVDCLYEHEVEKKQTVSDVQKMVVSKLKSSRLNDSSELTMRRKNFKEMLYATKNKLKLIWKELAESINQLQDLLEMEDKFYMNFIKKNDNPTELSNTDLEKLVQIIIGKHLLTGIIRKNLI